jgi:hypothetical protein
MMLKEKHYAHVRYVLESNEERAAQLKALISEHELRLSELKFELESVMDEGLFYRAKFDADLLDYEKAHKT